MTSSNAPMEPSSGSSFFSLSPRIGIGTDLVRISEVAESMATFGERYLRRVYTPDEVSYAAQDISTMASRLAARMAAKEAAAKALGLVNRVSWKDIEIRREQDGACSLALHGTAAQFARARGLQEVSMSLSHEGDYATAVVFATFSPSPAPRAA